MRNTARRREIQTVETAKGRKWGIHWAGDPKVKYAVQWPTVETIYPACSGFRSLHIRPPLPSQVDVLRYTVELESLILHKLPSNVTHHQYLTLGCVP